MTRRFCLLLVAVAAGLHAQHGGELRFCLHSEPKTFHPLRVADDPSEVIRYLTGGVLIRTAVAQIREQGRSTQGVTLIALDEGERLAGIERIDERDDQGYVLVASNGGPDRPPGWLFNIEASPAVEIQVGRNRSRATARVVTADDPVYPRLWKLVNDRNHGRYDRYQTRTSRPIPLAVITPST